ncbi:hypothetical protein QO227_21260 [Vibrio vulnificus]|nr:hypothetical protein [Vibrio vulnificus]MCG6296202.1 hypothetical protein [Vibrio vulnificus]MCU8111910.1 hypothetical protein [Vibrio vulnificus]MDK2604750.1 hypothetical protein [Vibrio vulnificus]MDK2627046.1 hypothetical protein [Vibrio vulnificus]MDK2644681.1 hypothetical protein [Vibrio vulnificus]
MKMVCGKLVYAAFTP